MKTASLKKRIFFVKIFTKDPKQQKTRSASIKSIHLKLKLYLVYKPTQPLPYFPHAKNSVFQTFYYHYQLDNNKRGNTLLEMPRCNTFLYAKVILESCNFLKPWDEGAWDRFNT